MVSTLKMRLVTDHWPLTTAFTLPPFKPSFIITFAGRE